MIDFDLEYLEDEFDDLGLVLALKMIELRIYTDICYTEEEIKNTYDGIERNNKGTVFLNKIKWFRKWMDMKNSNLSRAGLTNIDEMEVDDILNAVIINDSAGFKRRKIFKEALSTPIYIINEEEICKEDEYIVDFNREQLINRLML